jgi:hypothetical protein
LVSSGVEEIAIELHASWRMPPEPFLGAKLAIKLDELGGEPLLVLIQILNFQTYLAGSAGIPDGGSARIGGGVLGQDGNPAIVNSTG